MLESEADQVAGGGVRVGEGAAHDGADIERGNERQHTQPGPLEARLQVLADRTAAVVHHAAVAGESVAGRRDVRELLVRHAPLRLGRLPHDVRGVVSGGAGAGGCRVGVEAVRRHPCHHAPRWMASILGVSVVRLDSDGGILLAKCQLGHAEAVQPRRQRDYQHAPVRQLHQLGGAEGQASDEVRIALLADAEVGRVTRGVHGGLAPVRRVPLRAEEVVVAARGVEVYEGALGRRAALAG